MFSLSKCFSLVGLICCLIFPNEAVGADATQSLKIGDGKAWSFMNGPWVDGDNGTITPPDGEETEYMAVVRDREYDDFDAKFRFKFRSAAGGARLLFRLQDSKRYYALDIPFGGQQSRVRHFWAGLVVADGTPLQRYLNFGLVPGLGAIIDHWYEARVEARGSRLRAWVDGRLVADVEDTTYKRGRIGLSGIVNPYTNNVHFADLAITGKASPPARALEAMPPGPPYWITPCALTDPNTYQSYPGLLQQNEGKLVASVTFGNPNESEVRSMVWVRSSDQGRTWSAPERATLQHGLGANFVRGDGTWVCIFSKQTATKPEESLYSYESSDEGKTWAGPRTLKTEGAWPAEFKLPGNPIRPVRLHDGAILLPVIVKIENATFFQPTVYSAFALRSTDEGKTWSAPVRCDADNLRRPEGTQWMSASFFYELGIAEVADNVILGIGRPGMDPYMWQIQSDDGGKTWMPGVIGPFPGYCPSLTKLKDGALVATTRFPYFTAHLSRDAGRTWEPPVILDYATWANQHAVEAEPNVVLVNYMGDIMKRGQADNRMLRLRVTDAGLKIDN